MDKWRLDIQWPEDRPFQVVAFGLNAVDWICVVPRFPEHGSKLRIEERYQLGGGQIATAAALCARYGLKVRYVGRVGDDEIGRFSLGDLQREKMDLTFLEVVPGACSQYAVILVDRPTGERTVLWDRDPKLLYEPGALQREAIVGGQILHLDGHDLKASVQAAKWAREAGMKVSLDIDSPHPGVEDLLALVDFAIPGEDFAREYSSSGDWRLGLAAIAKVVPGVSMVTRGKKGVAVWWEGGIHEFPGFEVRAVDTTGAGDVFHGAFIYAILRNSNLAQAIQFASAAAMLSCMQYGARNSIPPLEETQKVVENLTGSGRNRQEISTTGKQ